MQEKWKDKGLVVVTVNINVFPDKTSSEENNKGALEKLKEKKVVGLNLFLDEPESVLTDKLDISAFPAAYVFDRQGRWTALGGNLDKNPVPDEKIIDPLVLKLLEAK